MTKAVFRHGPCSALLKLVVLWLLAVSAGAQSVTQVWWRTTHAAPPISLAPQQREWFPLFRSTLRAMPEESIIALALTQGAALGLEQNESARLQNLFSSYYPRVRATAPFRNAPSALPYCFSDTKLTSGLATVYLPARITRETREIIFLHGDGGSLVAYLHYLSTLFPDTIIVCPAYGVSPGNIPFSYVAEAQGATAAWTQTLKHKPILLGLSAGGVGGCRIYAQQPGKFERLVCLGSIPPSDAIERFSQTAVARFVSGAKEPYVTDGTLARLLTAAKKRAPNVRWATIPGADHYFILSHEEQTRKLLREFCAP